jgi:type IV secretion system protein VirB9
VQVAAAEAMPLPGQFAAGTAKPNQATDPTARVNQANAAARVQPVRNGFINSMQVYPFVDGALYQVYASPGQITDIAPAPASSSSAPAPSPPATPCAGSSAPRAAPGQQIHILVKPTRAGVADQPRHQHRPPHLSYGTALDAFDLYGVGFWQYPQDQLIALRRQNSQAEAAQPVPMASTSRA